MAVVQISKIQIRRGRKTQGTGMPQLASGELAWAIDTQEVFIGNGAVSEGAPYVGNTKILTEHDNIIDLVGQYQYKYDSQLGQSLVPYTVNRSVQNRLDEGSVNARSFGIIPTSEIPVGDEIDQTEKIQNAVNSISATTKVILEFDPGEYEISETINLPSNVKVSGFGKDITIFKYTGTDPIIFNTANNSSRILLKEFSIKISSDNVKCLVLNNTTHSNFENIKLIFDNGGIVNPGTILNNRTGIEIVGNGLISNNKFSNLEFERLTYGIYSASNSSYNTIDNCLFNYLHNGIILGLGSSNGADYNIVSSCIFDNITEHGIIVEKGKFNRSEKNTFKNVGSTLSGTNSFTSIIKFVTESNSSTDDIFERQFYLEPNNPLFNNNMYLSEIEGVVKYEKTTPREISLPTTANEVMAFKLPLNNANGFKVDYVFHSTTHNQVRHGTLSISVDKNTGRAQLTDEYEYTSFLGNDDEKLIFTVDIQTISTSKVLRVKYINTNTTDTNTFVYSYSVLS